MSTALKFNGVIQEQVSISWRKVSVFAENEFFYGLFPPTERELIHDVSGEAKCGRLLAIMGSTGAGKTTLLSAISGRQVDGLDVDGIFGINGHTTNLRTIKSVSAFVPQEDLFLSNLTVAEHLNYQGTLRLSGGYHQRQIKDRIDELVTELDLRKCLNVYIGGLRRKGISGGEKKRVAIASEILGSPPVLFLDEPTSGLDLYVAEKIVTLLRKLCAGGSTIVCTIHQPSSQMFHQFDDLLLLSEGRVAFLGTLGDAQTFFERQGAEIPFRYNPIDVYIRLLAIDSSDYNNCIERSEEICYAFESSEFRELVYIDRKTVKLNAIDFKASCWKQFTVVMRRTCVNNWREKMYGISLLQDFIAAFVFSLLFGRQELNQTGVKNINGTLFFLTLILTFQMCFLEIRMFYEELPFLKRELESGAYSATAAFWGYVVAQLPHQLLTVLMFTVIFYINIGYGASFTRFCNFILTAVLLSQAVMSFTYVFRNLMFPLMLTIKLVLTILRVTLLLSGTLIDFSTLPEAFHFLKSIAFAYLANEAFIVNQWHDVKNISCETLKINKNQTFEKVIAGYCLDNGMKVIESFNYDEQNFESDNIRQLFLVVIFRLIANIVICLRLKQF